MSFENLSQWVKHIEEANEKYIIFLVGNKADLSDHRAVGQSHGKNKMKELKNCVRFIETSASNDLESIQDLFNDIAK